ncbi:xylulokinase [Azospirillum sp. ST 5-10]|uniref:xylulokinase n=1 Tax=unclassified Azospirillum TaxID=2630922 RepID=UPI003F4A7189
MPVRDLLLAIDAGSSSVRAGLFDADGRCRRQASRPVASTVQGALCECDPEALLRSTLAVLGDVLAADPAAAARVAAVGVTAALGTVLCDGEGRALAPIVTWQDRRAVAEAEDLRARLGADAIHAATGRRSDPELTVPKLLWFARHQPQPLARAAHALSVKDWLVFHLTGEAVTDPSSASYTLAFDVVAGTWRDDLIAGLGLRPGLFPPVRGAEQIAGTVTAAAAARTGLLDGTPVVVGAPDGTVAGIGGGSVRRGRAIDVIGTTDVVFAYTPVPVPDAAGRLVLNRFPVGTAWMVGGPMAATGGAVAHVAALLGGDVERLTEAARGVPPGAAGVTVSPAFAGTRTPRWNAGERASVAGLGFEHGPAHLFRATLEGCAYAVADVFDALAGRGLAIDEVRGVGGGTRNALWMAVRAAVLDRPIVIPEVVEASSLGAAVLAAVGVGLYPDLAAATDGMVRIARRIEPDPELAGLYAELRRQHARSVGHPPPPAEAAGGAPAPGTPMLRRIGA